MFFLPLCLATLFILIVLDPSSDSAWVWQQMQLLSMAMTKVFLMVNLPFPPLPKQGNRLLPRFRCRYSSSLSSA